MIAAGKWLSLFLSYYHELGCVQECAFDFGIGENADGVARGFGVARRFFAGVFERAVAVEDGQDIGMSGAIEGAVAQYGFDLVAFGGGATLQAWMTDMVTLPSRRSLATGLREHSPTR